MAEKPKIRSAYDGKRISVTVGGGETMVRTAFQDECDVNRILARYKTSGVLPLMDSQAVYGDVSEYTDFKEAVDFANDAMDRVENLPERAREQLLADPVGFFAAVRAAENRDDLVAIGLVEALPEPDPAVVPPVVEPPVEPAAE